MKLYKNPTNLEIAELLRNVAAGYKLKGEEKNRFRIIAYERAADSIEHASSEIKDVWDEGKLEDIPGIGESIAKHLNELFKTGRSKHIDSIMKGIPENAFKLMELPGIGIKTALKLIKEEPKSEIKKMLDKVKKKNKEKRLLLPYALEIAGSVIDWLRKDPNALRVEPLGSLRRMVSTIGDIDIAVASNEAEAAIEHFSKYPKAKKVIEKGESSSSILLPGEIQVDLRVVKPESFGSLLQHFTGSKHHNIALREYSIRKGLSLSEYGIKQIKNLKLKIKNFKDEESLYNFLGLAWIPPELREDAGEIDAFAERRNGEHSRTIPNLVEMSDIKSDLHVHSSFDVETSHDLGESSVKDIVGMARKLNYEYIALTEHNPSNSGHTPLQTVEILKRKREMIEHYNYSLRNKNTKNTQRGSTPLRQGYEGLKRVFNSLEIDIMPDGRLPISEEGLETLDFAVIAIHSSFNASKEEMTKRILYALSHPKAMILAHPTARKLNKREGVGIDWPKIFEFCKRNNKWLEINADPMRLDLPDFLVREAVKEGVKLTIATDSHHKNAMNNMIYGVSVARRGWAKANDIINTKSLTEFKKLLKEGD